MALEERPCPAGAPHHPKPERKPNRHEGLTTLQVNALSQFMESRNFTAQDIARFSYAQIARLPKIGNKGMVRIEAWLASYGLQLAQQQTSETRRAQAPKEQAKLSQAVRLLRKNGYDVLPPELTDKPA